MLVTVPNATLTATESGVWGSTTGSTMTFVPLQTAAGEAFNIYIKGACSGTYGFTTSYYNPGSTGTVIGAVMNHANGVGIGPRWKSDVAEFTVAE